MDEPLNTDEIRAKYFPKKDIPPEPAIRRPFFIPIPVLGAVLYWAALPPLNLWPLVFLVPVVWTVLIGRQSSPRYRDVYFSAFVFWIASIWWIACPHPLTSVGLLALAGWLSIYWPLFILTARTAVHRFKIPIVLAAPICWMGCEYLRYHLLSGFSFCALEHALYLKPRLIQIAELGGQYLVGAVIILIGTGFAVPLLAVWESTDSPAPKRKIPLGLCSGLFAATVLALSVFYDDLSHPYAGLESATLIKSSPVCRIATLQGNIPVRLNGDPDLVRQTFEQFTELTIQAVREGFESNQPIDLVVWPETVCPVPVLIFQGEGKPGDAGLTDEEADRAKGQLLAFARHVDTPILYGLSTYIFEGDPEPIRLNSALLVDPAKNDDNVPFGPRYDKVHLVMFGEYIPFSKYLSKNFFLKTLCQEAGRGMEPVAMPLKSIDDKQDVFGDALDDTFYGMVNICFESSVPHLIRNQLLTLKEQGRNPAVLINISNDGWFRFSQQIDQHLATHVFRAIENGRPYITATNGGFAAIIDSKGRIQQIGQRRKAQAVVGDVSLTHLASTPYHRIGDRPAFVCMLMTIGLSIIPILFPKKGRENSKPFWRK